MRAPRVSSTRAVPAATCSSPVRPATSPSPAPRRKRSTATPAPAPGTSAIPRRPISAPAAATTMSRLVPRPQRRSGATTTRVSPSAAGRVRRPGRRSSRSARPTTSTCRARTAAMPFSCGTPSSARRPSPATRRSWLRAPATTAWSCSPRRSSGRRRVRRTRSRFPTGRPATCSISASRRNSNGNYLAGYTAADAASATTQLAAGSSFTLSDGTTVVFQGAKPTTIAHI